MKPKISVVVIVFNGEAFIERCIRSLSNQTYENYEVILIDDCSTDSTPKIVQNLAEKDRRIFVHRNSENLGVAKTRNIGIKCSTGEYIAFIDSDAIAHPDWLKIMIESLTRNKGEAVGGYIKTPIDLNYFARCLGTIRKPAHLLKSKDEAYQIVTCNAMFKRSLLLEIGGFDEGFRLTNEDTDLNIRIKQRKKRIYYQSKAVVEHYHRDTLRKFIRWRFPTGIGQCMIAKKYSFKVKKIDNIFNLSLIPSIVIGTFSMMSTKPVLLLLIFIVFYVVHLTKSYFENKSEFNLKEISLGVLLNWLSRLIASIGYYYGMITLPHKHQEILPFK